MDRQPVLHGHLVTLRPLTSADWAALHTVASDPMIWELHPAHDRWREDVFRRFFDDALACSGALAIIDRATGAIIGSSRYDMHDTGHDEIEIGWTFLAREYWGGPYNREVKQLMLDHILHFVGTVLFIVGENNLRSRRAMLKIGATLVEGRHQRGNGDPLPGHVIYAISRGHVFPSA